MHSAEAGVVRRRLRAAAIRGVTPRTSLYTFAPAHGSTLDDFDFVPGQVAVLSRPEALVRYESMLAIASPPSERGELEFLVKSEGSSQDWLAEIGVGDEVELAGPVGTGFPIDEHGGKDLIFAAMGTAIAPVRSAVLHAIERRATFGRIEVVYGARSPEDLAFADEFDSWRSTDVKLSLTVTQPGDAWGGVSGRLQELLPEAVRHALDPVVFVCGSDEMMDGCTEVLGALGVPRERVLRNY